MGSLQGANPPANVPGASAEFNQFVANTRFWLRDFAELNRLVAGQESNDRMIAFCAIDAISDFNSTPPHIGTYGFTDFSTRGWTSLLRVGTTVHLLQSVGILQTRNHLPFSDGGINVAVSDKTPLLQAWIQMLERKWELQKQQVKISLNIAQLLSGEGGVVSEYFDIHGYFAEVY